MTTSPTAPTRFHLGLALFVIYTVWGSTYLSIRYAIATIPPFLMAGSRFIIAGVLFYFFLRLRGFSRPGRREWKAAFVVGTFLLLGGNGLVGWAEQTVPSGLAAILVSVAPLWMVFFERIGPQKKNIRPLVLLGLLLGFIGVIWLMGPSLLKHGGGKGGFVALLFAPVLWAFGSVLSKRLPRPSSPFMTTAVQMLAGGTILLLVGLIKGETTGFSLGQVSHVSWMAYIYLIFVGSIVGFSSFVWLISHAPISIAGTYAYVNPVVAVFLGWMAAGEVLTFQTFLSGSVILLAVGLITIGEFRTRR